jgi:hypothetical protein
MRVDFYTLERRDFGQAKGAHKSGSPKMLAFLGCCWRERTGITKKYGGVPEKRKLFGESVSAIQTD